MAFRLEAVIYSKRDGAETFTITLGVFDTRTEAFRRMRQPWAVASYEETEGMNTNGSNMFFPPHRVHEYKISQI